MGKCFGVWVSETGLHAVRWDRACCAFDGVVGFEYQAETYRKDEWIRFEGV